MSARKIVFKLLIKTEESGAYSKIALDSAFEQNKLNERDKGFAAAMFYGILERRMTLDYVIRAYSSKGFDSLDKSVVQLLRMGLYQLLYMDSVPESAAVNETVALASPRQKGFINAVLRSFLRDGCNVNYGELSGDARLSVEYSCPKWLVKMWRGRFGEERTLGLLRSSLGRPPLFLRVNTLRCSADELIAALAEDGITARKNELLPDCVELMGGSPDCCSAYWRGLFHVQDISSQLCCKILGAQSGETVLDMCAAPGGKSFTAAEYMKNEGRLISFDLHENKFSLIKSGAKRLGLSVISARQNDASVFDPDIPQADRVLCDVVCSGLGVIRRKPEIKYKPKQEIMQLPPIQAEILETAKRYVKRGGRLVYSTCTLNEAENEAVVEEFLRNNPDFSPEEIKIGIDDDGGFCRNFFPEKTGGDGFFAALLKRNG